MFCPNCGNQLSDEARFCSNCGYKKDGGVNQNSNFVLHKNSFNLNKLPLIPLLCIVAIIVFCVIGYKKYNSRTCKYCDNKVFKESLCRDHYLEQTSINAAKGVISGEKTIGEAAKDVYDKSLTKEEKKNLEDSFERMKRSLNGTYTEEDVKFAEENLENLKKNVNSIIDLFK